MGVIIVAMVLGFTLIVVKMGLDHSKTKLQELNEAPSDATLLMSELEDMIASSVSEAVEPLKFRIEQLESRKLSESTTAKRLDLPASQEDKSESNQIRPAQKSHTS